MGVTILVVFVSVLEVEQGSQFFFMNYLFVPTFRRDEKHSHIGNNFLNKFCYQI